VTKTIKDKKHPSCFGSMYELGEEHMGSHCMTCQAFNECKKIGGGIEIIPASLRIPMEPAQDYEYNVKW